jgi:hypothetical protein
MDRWIAVQRVGSVQRTYVRSSPLHVHDDRSSHMAYGLLHEWVEDMTMTHEHDSHCVPDEPMYVEVGVYLCARRHLFELEGQTAWSVTCPVCACTASVQSVYTRVRR